ncbi:MAG: zinc ribbon domain-containing protein [Terriglobia bacterium]|jgi:hypothetical protein
MQCPKCKQENAETVPYCVRCHAPLQYICPACKHVQSQGGSCEKCGVDFAKYAAMLVFRAQSEIGAQREHTRARTAVWRQVLLLPLTGGLSLVKFLLGKLRGR